MQVVPILFAFVGLMKDLKISTWQIKITRISIKKNVNNYSDKIQHRNMFSLFNAKKYSGDIV